MTNEEKAREFLSHIIAEFNDDSRNRENIVALGKLFEVCFLSACEWKDQQFKELHNPAYSIGFADGRRLGEDEAKSKFKAFLGKIGRGEKWAAFERFMEGNTEDQQ